MDPPLLSVRLVNDAEPAARWVGRVEVEYDGAYGTVCADAAFGDADAQTICAQLGFRWVAAVAGRLAAAGLRAEHVTGELLAL